MSLSNLFFYRYYLIDSMVVDGKYFYQIQFKPKRKQSLCFVGNMWINDTTFAIKRLKPWQHVAFSTTYKFKIITPEDKTYQCEGKEGETLM